ncbi:hypothetical protein GCM10023222_16060 [Saccharopolyspora cebuensis]
MTVNPAGNVLAAPVLTGGRGGVLGGRGRTVMSRALQVMKPPDQRGASVTPYAPSSTAAVLHAVESAPDRFKELRDSWPDLADALVVLLRAHHRTVPPGAAS